MRFLVALACAILLLPAAAQAQVELSFHSFNGSMFGGRYPHTFIVLEGTLDATGEAVHENYGYTAVSISPAILTSDVAGTVHSEPERYIAKTNRHFTVPLSDEQYRAIVAEVRAWRDEGGRHYNLGKRNCVHFVARIAQMAGLSADVPDRFTKKPKAWLNYITGLNPQLGAKAID